MRTGNSRTRKALRIARVTHGFDFGGCLCSNAFESEGCREGARCRVCSEINTGA